MLAKLGLLALAAIGVQAHTVFTGIYVDGVGQGDSMCIRMSDDIPKASFPIKYDSDDLACNVNGQNGVDRVCPIKDGSIVTFEWRTHPSDANHPDGAIDYGHKGPCAVYMKKVDSARDDGAIGDGWFKLYESGYDAEMNQWCNQRLQDDHGFLSIQIPEGIQAGQYLLRPELLALHAASPYNPDGPDPQFYTGCAQVSVESSGDLVPKDTVSIPGYVSLDDPGVVYNLYEQPMDLPYIVPGPEIVEFEHGTIAEINAANVAKPKDCILEMANWCGVEVPEYTDQIGCWDSVDDCWGQSKDCWDSTTPTGGALCEVWDGKCHTMGDHCEAGDYNGPPNAGKDLTPEPMTISPKVYYMDGYGQATQASNDSMTVEVIPKTESMTIEKVEMNTASITSANEPVATTTEGNANVVYETIFVTRVEYVTIHKPRRHYAHNRNFKLST